MNDQTEPLSVVSHRDAESTADDQAMLRLLDRPLSDDDLRESTQRVAQTRSQPAQDMASALLFRIGGEQLAVPATDVARVTQVSAVRRIPHRSNHIIRGLCNIDGELVLCGSLSDLLELPDDAPAGNAVKRLSEGIGGFKKDQQRMVVLGLESNRWAIRVDCVLGVRHYETTSCKPPPVTVRQAMRCYTTSLLALANDDVATLLDVSQVLYGFKAALT